MIHLLQNVASQTPEDVSKFVFDAFERNVVIATIVLLCVALVAVFAKWQRDIACHAKQLSDAREKNVKIAADDREAVAKIVQDMNNRLDAKDAQVIGFALEMRDAMNTMNSVNKGSTDAN